jgi:hypothetical protein
VHSDCDRYAAVRDPIPLVDELGLSQTTNISGHQPYPTTMWAAMSDGQGCENHRKICPLPTMLAGARPQEAAHEYNDFSKNITMVGLWQITSKVMTVSLKNLPSVPLARMQPSAV